MWALSFVSSNSTSSPTFVGTYVRRDRLLALSLGILTGELRLAKATFFQWRTPPPGRGVTSFSYHRRGMSQVVLWCLVPLAAIEVAVVHLLLRHWSSRAAWVATDLGMLGSLYLVGLAKSLRLYPIEVTATTLKLRLGLLRERCINRSTIVGLTAPTSPPPGMKVTRMTLLDPPDLVVRISTVSGIEQIEFNVDDPRAFLQHLSLPIAAADF